MYSARIPHDNQSIALALLAKVPTTALIATLKTRLLGGDDLDGEIVRGAEQLLEIDAALTTGRRP